jgi:hypothetical protein
MALNLATSFRGEPRGSFGRGHQASAVDVEDQALLHHEACLIARLRSWLCWPSQLLARAVLLTRRGFSRRQVWWSPPAASRRAPSGASSLSSSQSIRSRAIARWIGPLRASGLQARVNSQLRKDVLHVPSHRLGRESQLRSHLIASTPDDEKLEHSLLLLGQVLRCGGNEGRPTGRC